MSFWCRFCVMKIHEMELYCCRPLSTNFSWQVAVCMCGARHTRQHAPAAMEAMMQPRNAHSSTPHHARPCKETQQNTRTPFPSKIFEPTRICIDQAPEHILPRTAMSLSYWAQACATAVDRPLQAKLDSAHASCGVTVSVMASALNLQTNDDFVVECAGCGVLRERSWERDDVCAVVAAGRG